MRTVFGYAVAMAILVGGTNRTRADDDAMAIVDKAIKAHGGAEKLGKFQAEQWKAKGTVVIMDQKLPYTAEYYFQQPDKLRFDMKAEFGGMKLEISAGMDGKEGWEKSMGMVQEMSKEKFEEMQHSVYTMYLSQVLSLKDKALTLTAAGETKVNDKPAVGIKITQKGRRDVTMYFDKETGLLAKSVTMAKDEFAGNKEVKQEVFITGWKDKGGNKVFEKLAIHRDGKPFIEEEFSDQKSLEKLDPKLFAKP